jgi:hypothetical protein
MSCWRARRYDHQTTCVDQHPSLKKRRKATRCSVAPPVDVPCKRREHVSSPRDHVFRVDQSRKALRRAPGSCWILRRHRRPCARKRRSRRAGFLLRSYSICFLGRKLEQITCSPTVACRVSSVATSVFLGLTHPCDEARIRTGKATRQRNANMVHHL